MLSVNYAEWHKQASCAEFCCSECHYAEFVAPFFYQILKLFLKYFHSKVLILYQKD